MTDEMKQMIVAMKMHAELTTHEIAEYFNRRGVGISESQIWNVLMEQISSYGTSNHYSAGMGRAGD